MKKSIFCVALVISYFSLFFIYKLLRFSPSPSITVMYFCLAFLVFSLIGTLWFIYDGFKMWFRDLDKNEHPFVSFMELIEGLGCVIGITIIDVKFINDILGIILL